mgnify:CR=1 FL=1
MSRKPEAPLLHDRGLLRHLSVAVLGAAERPNWLPSEKNMPRLHLALLSALAVSLGSACEGKIGDGGPVVGGITTAPPQVQAACSTNYSPGHVAIHRLTNDEYNNTVRDLLFTATRPADAFDPNPPGESGFTNDSLGLLITDDLVASYYAAAEALAKEVIASKATAGGAYSRIVNCAPSAACAQATITTFASRAYRRPASSAEVATLMNVFNANTDFDTGIQDAINAALVSPKFLFEYFAGPSSQVAGATFPVDDYALASRLSYAMWQTMPDDQLMQLASSGQLHDPATLQVQVARMLKDPRIGSFLTSLRNDWLQLEQLAAPSGTLVGLDDTVRLSMVGEVDAYLQDMVRSDSSMLGILTGDHTFVNQTMATYYGIPFPGSDPTAFVRVPAPPHRGGLVVSPALMTETSGDVAYTHPVHRGKWILDNITCDSPPPKPPNVPPTNLDPSAGGGTPRQKLAVHVQNPGCSGCHTVMDALGLGLENYDMFGNWRDAYPGNEGVIDASGKLGDGTPFTVPSEMLTDIAQEDHTRACIAKHVMAYAITRALTSPDDECVANAIGTASVTPTGSFSELLDMIVQSRQFLMQTGEAP